MAKILAKANAKKLQKDLNYLREYRRKWRKGENVKNKLKTCRDVDIKQKYKKSGLAFTIAIDVSEVLLTAFFELI